jgi:hypothetical protein
MSYKRCVTINVLPVKSLLLIHVFNQSILIEDKFNKEEVITNSQIMKLVHQHQKLYRKKNEMAFKQNKRI